MRATKDNRRRSSHLLVITSPREKLLRLLLIFTQYSFIEAIYQPYVHKYKKVWSGNISFQPPVKLQINFSETRGTIWDGVLLTPFKEILQGKNYKDIKEL